MKTSLLVGLFVAALLLVSLFCIIRFASEVQKQSEDSLTDNFEDHTVVRLSRGLDFSAWNDNHAFEASLRYPYIVAIAAQNTSNSPDGWRFTCFGSVIQKKWIVTAAHCHKQEHSHRVLLFYDYIRNTTRSHLVAQWAVHAGFDANTTVPLHDIALARVEEDLQPVVNQPALIQDYKVHAGIWKTLFTMDRRTYLTNDLDIYEADITDPSRCYELYGFSLDQTLLCIDMSRYPCCFVTEFGPLFTASERVVGVLRIKPTDCDIKVAVFTNVSAYSDWILKATDGSKLAP